MAISIVTLPSTPPPLQATMKPLSFATEMGGTAGGPLGGPTQRVLRVGDRFAVDYQMPPMPYDAGRQWLARLMAAAASPAAMIFPQRGLSPVSPNGVGTVCVAGPQTATTNTGQVLALRDGAVGFTLLAGQVFHINASVDGRRYLHMLSADVAFAADGTATLSITPALRFVPADGDTTEWVAPMIEGFVTMGWSWTIELVRRVGLKFTVTEDR